jgi:hypothetical protein
MAFFAVKGFFHWLHGDMSWPQGAADKRNRVEGIDIVKQGSGKQPWCLRLGRGPPPPGNHRGRPVSSLSQIHWGCIGHRYQVSLPQQEGSEGQGTRARVSVLALARKSIRPERCRSSCSQYL